MISSTSGRSVELQILDGKAKTSNSGGTNRGAINHSTATGAERWYLLEGGRGILWGEAGVKSAGGNSR
jgi:hypothetical protein